MQQLQYYHCHSKNTIASWQSIAYAHKDTVEKTKRNFVNKKALVFLFLVSANGGSSAHIFSFLQRKPVIPQLVFITPEKAMRVRIMLGFASGLLPNLFFSAKTQANVFGVSVLSGATYLLNKKGYIIKNEHDLLEVGNAYIVGVLGGILVRSAGLKAKEFFDRLFNKPEARVVLVRQHEEEQEESK